MYVLTTPNRIVPSDDEYMPGKQTLKRHVKRKLTPVKKRRSLVGNKNYEPSLSDASTMAQVRPVQRIKVRIIGTGANQANSWK